MMGKARIFLLLSASMLQACAFHQLQNKIEGADLSTPSCDITYTLTVGSGYHNRTIGMQTTDDKRTMEFVAKYVAATEDVLQKRGCTFRRLEQNISASLNIHIERTRYVGALPQEWLTGLSLGLIPSWGTRKSEYSYSFMLEPGNRSHRYTVDTFSIGHLVLLPFGFFPPDEYVVYREALGNFLSH